MPDFLVAMRTVLSFDQELAFWEWVSPEVARGVAAPGAGAWSRCSACKVVVGVGVARESQGTPFLHFPPCTFCLGGQFPLLVAQL